MEAISTYSVTPSLMNMGLFQICVLPWPSEDQLVEKWFPSSLTMSYDPVKATDKGDYYAEEQVHIKTWTLDIIIIIIIGRFTRRPGTLESFPQSELSSLSPTSASASGSGAWQNIVDGVGGGGLKTIEYQVWFGLLGMDWRDPMVHLLECNVSKHHTIEHNVNNGTQWHTYWNVM